LPHYAPGVGKPTFDDGDMFHVTVPITAAAEVNGEVDAEVTAQVNPQVTPQVAPQVAPQVTPQVTAQVTVQVAPQVTAQVTVQVLSMLAAERSVSAAKLQNAAGLKHRVHFLKSYLNPMLQQGLIERTIPDKPRSRLQRYRLTEKGRSTLQRARRKRP